MTLDASSYEMRIWDDKHDVVADVIWASRSTPSGEVDRSPHGYARTIGETLMFWVDNTNLGHRRLDA